MSGCWWCGDEEVLLRSRKKRIMSITTNGNKSLTCRHDNTCSLSDVELSTGITIRVNCQAPGPVAHGLS